MDTLERLLQSPLVAQVFTITAGVALLAAAVDHWRAIQRMRAYSATLGLPIAPPVSRMRLAQWVEAMEPTMAGLWQGMWVRLWTRPVWVADRLPFSRGYKISIRATADRDLVPGLATPPAFIKDGLAVNGRELRVFTWGGVPMEEIPRYLSAAVAHARAITPPAGQERDR